MVDAKEDIKWLDGQVKEWLEGADAPDVQHLKIQ